MRSIIILLVLVITSGTCLGQTLSSASKKKLDNDIRYLIGQHSGYGRFAVAVVDHQGVVSQVNGSKAYPLASVFKLPLLLAVLDGQDKGTFPGSQSQLTITTSDQCIGSGRLQDSGVGSRVSVDKAAKLMMSISDNTATDLLFRKLGCEKLDPWLRKLGLKSSEILLTNRQAWLLSLGKVPGWGRSTPEARVARWEKLDRAGKLKLGQSIEASARQMNLKQFQAVENASTGTQTASQDNMLAARLDNKMSALDLANLMVRLDKGELLSQGKTKQAFSILAGQKYHSRLPKKLSPGSAIYHKTGTLAGVRNDAGILFTKNRDEGVAIVFLSQFVAPGASGKVDRLAGQVAKLVEAAYLKG